MTLTNLLSRLGLAQSPDAPAPPEAQPAPATPGDSAAGAVSDRADAEEATLERLDEIFLESADILDLRVVLVVTALLARADFHLGRLDQAAGDRARATCCLHRGHRCLRQGLLGRAGESRTRGLLARMDADQR